MGQRHAMNLLRLVPRSKLTYVCSPAQADLDWAATNLKPHGVKAYFTFEEMIETPGLQAVVISSITALHMPQTLAAIGRGIHVLCEKPICNSISELEALCARVEANPETKVMVAYVRRFDESYQDALTKIKAGSTHRPSVFRSHSAEKLDQSPFFH